MIIIYILLFLILLYLFMICPKIINKKDCSCFKGYYYAHRGLYNNNSDHPENSLKAIKKAVKHGYGIELDVQLTKDNELVVFHDASLKRVCGIDGNVWDYTYEELKQMKLFDSNETIPTFKEVLDTINGQVPFILEYKLDKPQTLVCELSNQLLKTYKGLYCIESFHPLALIWYKKNRPDIIRGQLSMNYWKEEKHKGKIIMLLLTYLLSNFLTRPDFIAYDQEDYKNISRKLCKYFKAFSVGWTVPSQERYEKIKNEFDIIIFENYLPK